MSKEISRQEFVKVAALAAFGTGLALAGMLLIYGVTMAQQMKLYVAANGNDDWYV